jgi:ATP-dependent helicase HrpB
MPLAVSEIRSYDNVAVRRPEPLPVDAHLDEVKRHLDAHRAVVVSAAPGAGKTTRIPPSLVDAGPVILLQPRRVAARAVTRRIAEEQGWIVGREVGWQIRFERRSSTETKLLVVTEGILTARLQHDPLLSDFTTIVFDEFHERSIHSDLGLALARQAWLARHELRLVVMSATLEVDRITRFLDDCPTVDIEGLLHPTSVHYAPDQSLSDAVAESLARTTGQVLCFLPGVPEIDRARRDLDSAGVTRRAEVLPLHGAIDGETQDRALRPTTERRVILATNIAETSLTVPGVLAVVDTGFHKVARYDVERGIDSLSLERVSQDAADQRAGRAGRLGPGIVTRLWDSRLRLAPHREPDIARLDLAGPVLYLLAWNEHPERFEWFQRPPRERITDALRLLIRLGAVDDAHHVTPLGRKMLQLPTHPRIARILLDGRGAPDVIDACAELSGDRAFREQLRHVVNQVVERPAVRTDDRALRHALFTGYADRLARRRRDDPQRVVMASGHGAVVDRECDSVTAEFLVALDVVASGRAGVAEARVRAASAVDVEWIAPTSSAIEHRLNAESGRVQAAKVRRFEALTLSEQPVAVDPVIAADILARAWLARGPDEATSHLLLRARFAGESLDLERLVHDAAYGATALDEIDVVRRVPYDVARRLDDAAPQTLLLPSGRTTRLEYGSDGSLAASVKLQELFGLADSPRFGARKVPVTFHLLAPNGRPVQTTQDLRSFWERTYPEVRKEMRGRYPRHPWPDDPWSATPTDRTKPRAGR